MNERSWAKYVCGNLRNSLPQRGKGPRRLDVISSERLPYRYEVFGYQDQGQPEARPTEYETDLLVIEHGPQGRWVPRVVIECKLRSLSTHDALTYSAKAETHKQVHPYLRYGILVGAPKDRAIPSRLFRHGSHFDFMVAWRRQNATSAEWSRFVRLVREEIRASRLLEELLLTARQPSRKRYMVIRRRLVFQR